ncbi:PaREP1 family protein [Pyrobaculum calidifontis]|uniref:PaREP1 domain containing protein n=1 Tax=Pyrobaculum calidifontis (strain DSM 21063 / JCM 11548 / VA1) TaxID=410359 RepID=A3MT58_PYRCJ|nr:PaREP1 family protein [Pyrobaculum calidifontis]ABO07825.1 PaREP1 domain containing protein [Pyrobaculum calidifontis JCM 11548]
METLPKPWFDLAKYREVRLKEALYEAELAERFLEEGFVRNAAGKAFQAWKTLVAAYAVDKVEELKNAFPGRKKPRGMRGRAESALWVLAIMPTTALKQVAQIVGGDVDIYTDKALWIHEYQYDGPDPQAILSPYPDDEVAVRDIKRLVEKVRELAERQLRR